MKNRDSVIRVTFVRIYVTYSMVVADLWLPHNSSHKKVTIGKHPFSCSSCSANKKRLEHRKYSFYIDKGKTQYHCNHWSPRQNPEFACFRARMTLLMSEKITGYDRPSFITSLENRPLETDPPVSKFREGLEYCIPALTHLL